MTSTASAAATPVRNQATHDTNLRFLLRPRSVAVVGASGVPTRIGGIIVRLLARHRFPGAVYPINPKYDNIEGFTCYPTLDAVPGDRPIDAAIIYLPLAAVTATVRACGERGVKGVVVISSGFAELGGEGVRLQEELAATANAYDMAMCGPNCAGIANFLADFVAYGTTNFIDLQDIEKGPVALLSASGGLGNTIFTYCQERHVGLSHLIGVGNEAVSTAADYLHLLVDDPDVGVVVGNIEAVRNPRRFFEAADRAAVARKPIVVLKGGRSEAGRHSIMTHTAALGGSPEAFAGAFRQHGVIQVNDLDELADCAMLLTRMEPCTARRLGVFSLPGGGTGLVSDLAADHGFEVPDLTPETIARLADILPDIAIPKNPLDPTAGFGRDSAKMHTALKTFASDPNIDILVFFPLASQVDYSQKLAEDLLAVKDEIGKPIVAIWTAGRDLEPGAWRTLHQGGVPLFVQTGPAFRALALARRYAEHLAGLGDPEARDLGPFAGQRARPLRLGDTAAERAELARFGIRLPRTELATSAAGAAETVAALGGPAAMKIASPDIAHKTEAGGVALGIASADEARDAFDRIVASARAHQPGATIDGVEVQEMIPEGVEMLLGLSTDDQLGPVLTVGLGGVLTEVLGDVAQRPVPVSRAEARPHAEGTQGGQGPRRLPGPAPRRRGRPGGHHARPVGTGRRLEGPETRSRPQPGHRRRPGRGRRRRGRPGAPQPGDVNQERRSHDRIRPPGRSRRHHRHRPLTHAAGPFLHHDPGGHGRPGDQGGAPGNRRLLAGAYPGSFESVNRNKEGLTLQLKHPAAQEVLRRLVAGADVLVEGFRPGVAERLGAGYDALRQVNPQLVYCSISGYGQEGPYRDQTGHDPNYLAVAGVLSLAGDPDGPPEGVLGASMADLSGAWFAAISILTALRARDRHGIGQYIDLALADASYALVQNRLAEYAVNGRLSKAKLMARPGIGLFETADGRYVTVAAAEDHFWESLCRTAGLDDWLGDSRLATPVGRREHGALIRTRLRTLFLTRTSDEWLAMLDAAGVPCSRVNDLGEAAEDPNAVARGVVQWQDHPILGPVPQVRFPALLSATPARIRTRPPLLGEHTEAILGELGYDDQTIKGWQEAGTV